MSTELEIPLPIFRVSVSSINLTYVNGLPQAEVHLHFLSAEGTVIGETRYSALSEGSWKAIEVLASSLEDGFRQSLSGDGFFQWNEESAKEGINYNEQGDWK
jgi:hypothetical protein